METGKRKMKMFIDDSAIHRDVVMTLDVGGAFAARRLKIPVSTRVLVYATKFRGKKYRDTHAECQRITAKMYLVKLTFPTIKSIARLEREGLMFYFHELTHVAQMTSGRLTFTRKLELPKWKGRDISSIAYADDPSEIEAFKLGYKLADEFAPHYLTAMERGNV